MLLVVWIKKGLTKKVKVTSLSDVSGEGIGALPEQNEKYGVENQAETMMLLWFLCDSE
ncbi:MAG TPA: hypothetical protein PK667_12835 [Nitrosomonas europaea]|uniref:hypothetical protein n=1 Tax=Nitrosomonas europaea TaxID=915 RepID=UPI0024916BC1|nr:hypothetical protein [Nitrosomonas europaea]HRO57456.1 hypothetical protein [Nitrosomonas europaea]HUM75055.1 hypothetical protein [Nitrosomonas europaea]